MYVCPSRACNESQDAPLEPLTPALIKRIAAFCFIELRHSNALCTIARHLHQRGALFCRDRMPIEDYRTILDAVHDNDPCLIDA